jgi:GT2 family glycosyltransferase
MPSVTVILPTWNRAEWLETAIESVLTQTFRDYELIVVDDASTDSTAEIIERHSGKIRCIILTKNRGVSAARNAAVLKATASGSPFWTQMIIGIRKNYKSKSNKPKFDRDFRFILLMKYGSGMESGSTRKKSIKNGRAGFFSQVWHFV